MPPKAPLNVRSNNEIEAESLVDQAEKKSTAFSFFGLVGGSQQSRYEDAGDMCAKAGNLYKIEKKCLYPLACHLLTLVSMNL